MITHNICFNGEQEKIIQELSLNMPSEQFLWHTVQSESSLECSEESP